MTYLIKRIRDNRFLGNGIWTYDIQRAIHFPTKKLADEKVKAYPKAFIINYPVS